MSVRVGRCLITHAEAWLHTVDWELKELKRAVPGAIGALAELGAGSGAGLSFFLGGHCRSGLVYSGGALLKL
jgi:hypothetical protein